MSQSNYVDLNVLYFGRASCFSSCSFDPNMRPFYLIYYVLEGSAIFEINKQRYGLEKGQGVLIYPNDLYFYNADGKNPCHYAWLAFEGGKVNEYLSQIGFSSKNPVYYSLAQNNMQIENIMYEMVKNHEQSIKITSLAHLFFHELIENSKYRLTKKNQNKKDYYMEITRDYIYANYWRDFCVSELSSLCALNRHYFTRIFKDHYGVTPQEFIINYKIEKAKALLHSKELSIGDISRSLGFNDPFYFSRIFSKATGKSPSAYKKEFIGK